MAELCGKATGTSQGMGGSMHIFSQRQQILWRSRYCRRSNSFRAGIAFLDKHFERNAVNICFFGDGAVRQGSLHETFNMAMNWKLPVVFVVETTNTQWELL